MLFFVKVRVEPKNLSQDELWDAWAAEAEGALEAKAAGKIVGLYKVSGQRRVLAIVNVESHDELDRIFMAGKPLSHYLEFEEIMAVREYEAFAGDLKSRWK